MRSLVVFTSDLRCSAEQRAETDEIKQIIKDGNLILGEVRFTLTYDETDESGQWPDQCDDISADLDTGEVSIAENGHTTTATLSDCEPSTMAVKLVSNYTGEGFNATNVSKSEVQGDWSADGEGWGNYVVTISVSTNTGSKPGPIDPFVLGNNEDGEEVNVKMQVIAYEIEFEEN